jgi:hypothetical protein
MPALRALVRADRLGFALARATDRQVVEHVRQMLERGELCWTPLEADDLRMPVDGGVAEGAVALVAAAPAPVAARPGALAPALKARADARPGSAPIASVATAAARPPATSLKRHWIAIELVGEDGSPIAGEPYSVVSPGGRLFSGCLDHRGSARIEDIESQGLCRVSFPRMDGAAWEETAR